MAIRNYIRRHGLKLVYVANGLGMDEGLLRYHLKRGFDNPELVVKFKALMRAHAAGVLDDLDEIQPPRTSPE